MLNDDHTRVPQRRLNSPFWFPRYIYQHHDRYINALSICLVYNSPQSLVELPVLDTQGRHQACPATYIDKIVSIEFVQATSFRVILGWERARGWGGGMMVIEQWASCSYYNFGGGVRDVV